MVILLFLLLVLAPIIILLLAFWEPARRRYPYWGYRNRRRWPMDRR